MWQDLVDQQEKWIGGQLIDFGDSMDRAVGFYKNGPITTTITGFELTDNLFMVNGKDFSCGGSRSVVAVIPGAPDNGLALGGYGGHKFHIVQPTGCRGGEDGTQTDTEGSDKGAGTDAE